MFSICSDCEHCFIYYAPGMCLAGNGDDDFQFILKEDFDWLLSHEDIENVYKEQLKENFPEYLL